MAKDFSVIGKNSTKKQQQMWRAIKIFRRFNALDLAISSSQPNSLITQGTAKRYMNFLAKAGYLKKQGTSYRLLPTHNTGKLPPLKIGKIGWYDQNIRRTGKFDNDEK